MYISINEIEFEDLSTKYKAKEVSFEELQKSLLKLKQYYL